jgi:hypothetical protein
MMTATVGPEVMARETARLIASDKVEGTAVRRSNGDKLGTIQRVMIDKRSGKVAYAVMTFGGFLGIGDEYRALPWSVLRYNERLDAYELDVTENQLRNAPVLATGWDTGEIGRDWEHDIQITIGRRLTGNSKGCNVKSVLRRIAAPLLRLRSNITELSFGGRRELIRRSSARHAPARSSNEPADRY